MRKKAKIHLRRIVFAAILASMSVILGKYLQIPNPFSNIIRLSFENLPIIISGICMGPLTGCATGAVADLVGCLLYGYTINPIVTLGAASVGAISGALGYYIVKNPLALRIALSVFASHIVGSVLIKSFGLASWYLSSYDMGLAELILWRLGVYTVIGICEFLIIYVILRNKSVSDLTDRMFKL